MIEVFTFIFNFMIVAIVLSLCLCAIGFTGLYHWLSYINGKIGDKQ